VPGIHAFLSLKTDVDGRDIRAPYAVFEGDARHDVVEFCRSML
jgi:hypothetical protein